MDPLDSQAHALFLRAMTSRLGEIRDVATLWGSTTTPLEAHYLSALRRVRDECHEWTASDVYRALYATTDCCSIRVPLEDEAEGEGEEEEEESALSGEAATTARGRGGGGELSVPLVRGLPQWSWPHYPRAPWLRYVCPVLESLLCSCYEDWLESALGITHEVLEAVGPMLAIAQKCREEDLVEPPPQEGEEGEEGEEEGGGVTSAGAGEARRMRHKAAMDALEFRRLAEPLLPALSCAAQCPSSATQRSAGVAANNLRKAFNGIKHLLQ